MQLTHALNRFKELDQLLAECSTGENLRKGKPQEREEVSTATREGREQQAKSMAAKSLATNKRETTDNRQKIIHSRKQTEHRASLFHRCSMRLGASSSKCMATVTSIDLLDRRRKVCSFPCLFGPPRTFPSTDCTTIRLMPYVQACVRESSATRVCCVC
jgi:hypothetical protein